MVIGAIFVIAGVVASVLLFLGWRTDPVRFPLVAVTMGLVFVALGSLFMVASGRAWQGKIRILRRGHLTRCRIKTCLHPQKGIWRAYSTVFNELREAWDKPVTAFNKKADTKRFERFGMVFGVASIVVFGFMGVVGLFLTVGFAHQALVDGKLVGWVGLGFLVLWWTVIVGMAIIFWRRIRVATTIGQQSLKSLGIKPIVDCRVEFELPGGKAVKAKTKVDLARRLAPENSGPDDLLIYDPWKPESVLLLSGFTPPLEVGEDGELRFAQST